MKFAELTIKRFFSCVAVEVLKTITEKKSSNREDSEGGSVASALLQSVVQYHILAAILLTQI